MTAASGADQPTLRDDILVVLATPRPRGEWADRIVPLIEADRERAKAEGGAEALEQAARRVEGEAHRLPVLAAFAAKFRARAAVLRGSAGGGT